MKRISILFIILIIAKMLPARDAYTAIPILQNAVGHLLINIKVNDIPGLFILDTGAGATVIDSKQADLLKLILQKEEANFSGAGAGGVGLEVIPSKGNKIELGQHIVPDLTLSVMSFEHVSQSLADAGAEEEIAGIVGVDILRPAKAIIDYGNMMLYLLTDTAIDHDAPSDFLDRLAGTWQAKGTSFGKPTDVLMKWEWTLQKKFIRISYRLTMHNENGSTTEFEGTAFYQPNGNNQYKATWFDSGGEMHPITATDDGATLTAIWGTEGVKLGKTTYRLFENKVEVVDYIQAKDKTWKEFNRNTLVKL